MRSIGIDLAIADTHQAVIVDEGGRAIGRPFCFGADPAELDELLRRARVDAGEDEALQVVMKPTDLSWFPMANYLIQRGVTVYLVNTQQVPAMRRFDNHHAKRDHTSARVLARLPRVKPEALSPLHLMSADYLGGQRWYKQQEELAELMTAIRSRVQDWERAFWPGLEQVVGDLFAPWVRRWREVWYDPWQLQSLGTRSLAHFLVEAGADPERVEELAVGLQTVACRAIALFGTLQGTPSPYADYATLQEQVLLELRLLAAYETELQAVRQWVQRLYRSRTMVSSAVVRRTLWAVSHA